MSDIEEVLKNFENRYSVQTQDYWMSCTNEEWSALIACARALHHLSLGGHTMPKEWTYFDYCKDMTEGPLAQLGKCRG